MLFLCYPRCTTCQKAKKWLDENKVYYTERHIVENNPSYDELKEWFNKSGLPLKKFFNTSGLLYKEMQLKDKLPKMSEEDELSYDMPTIILDDIISTFFIMNFPSKILCMENCKGLCDKCGQNLNDGECDCFKNRVGKNNPFADLLNSKKLGGN